jgi:hypothetical protein
MNGRHWGLGSSRGCRIDRELGAFPVALTVTITITITGPEVSV